VTTQQKAAPLVPEEVLREWAKVYEVQIPNFIDFLRDFATELLTEVCETCGGDGIWVNTETDSTCPDCGQHGAPKGRVVMHRYSYEAGFDQGVRDMTTPPGGKSFRAGTAAERERIVRWLRERSKHSDTARYYENQVADELEQEKDR